MTKKDVEVYIMILKKVDYYRYLNILKIKETQMVMQDYVKNVILLEYMEIKEKKEKLLLFQNLMQLLINGVIYVKVSRNIKIFILINPKNI